MDLALEPARPRGRPIGVIIGRTEEEKKERRSHFRHLLYERKKAKSDELERQIDALTQDLAAKKEVRPLSPVASAGAPCDHA